ncbi:MAG: NAD-dependent epimerase/dehydratase family protein, partial [Rhodobacterales bacterium]|nr:NAD-dependent epimerase/dehydratase family protein [Rhodobacterales bacterium]MDX5412741.1 NAD-dependent epimerase/dehydratase family protein [Rhodobacterales bacterium]
LTPVPTNADCPVAPASIYASTKLMQEYLLQQAFWGTGTRVGILRLQNVYGPGQSLNNPYTGVLSIFCRQIREGRALDIYEDGLITRDFVLVDDVVRAFAMMGNAGVMPQDILDIGSGQPATILDVARKLLALLDAPTDRLTVTGAFRPGDIRHAVADISRAATLLGWAPEATLDAGLASLAAWSRNQMSHVAQAGE